MILKQSIDLNDTNKASKSSLLNYTNEYPYVDDSTDYESINQKIELEKIIFHFITVAVNMVCQILVQGVLLVEDIRLGLLQQAGTTVL